MSSSTADAKKLYISVGSATNVDEQRDRRKRSPPRAILQANLDGSAMRVFASGMRNPVGMDWEAKTKTLWTVVNERDMLGDELVPDYLTSVKDGAFFGWPYSYYGHNEEPRKKGQRPDLVAKAIKPDDALGSHVAPLGLAFYTGNRFRSTITVVPSSACTVRGTARIWSATKSSSCHSRMANLVAQWTIFLPDSCRIRNPTKSTVARSASRSQATVRC